MKSAAALAPIILAVTACATTASPPPAEQARPTPDAGQCDAGGLDDLVGQPANAELGAKARDRAGARTIRWIQPGMAVTMDYRSDRLNIHLDGQNMVERFRCG
ncbi:I78 family peptidase inhibitor [Stakelama saccharophila]|uniref:I78 family peptidase inhibitor n=1 Tax=Stakelama saccharophila TaxID=3075605 RepID=A0ABZ0B588_9SPHN|nr:I78 family peptidase inhibitor [Stakelama sp. W311]WNO52550.1 I78 family peptidase inhibitor [Stakelama sp. W311]